MKLCGVPLMYENGIGNKPWNSRNSRITRWIAGLRPASLLGLRLPNKVGVFATHTMNHRKCSNKLTHYWFQSNGHKSDQQRPVSKGQIDICMDRRTLRWTEGHIDGQKDVWINRRTYGWTEGHMDGQKDKIIKNSFLIIKNFLWHFFNIFFNSFLALYM